MLGAKHLAKNEVTAARASTPLRAAYKATNVAQRLICSANQTRSSAYSYILTRLLSTRNAICHTLLTYLHYRRMSWYL